MARIEEHNRALRALAEAIPAEARGAMAVDAFCALPARADIDAAIQEAERNLAAARSADAVRQAATFGAFSLPSFEIQTINSLLARTLPDLESVAAASVQVRRRRDVAGALGRERQVYVRDVRHDGDGGRAASLGDPGCHDAPP